MKSHKSEIRNQFHDKVLLPAKIIYSLLENAYLLNLWIYERNKSFFPQEPLKVWRYKVNDKTTRVFITGDFPNSTFDFDSHSNYGSKSIDNFVF